MSSEGEADSDDQDALSPAMKASEKYFFMYQQIMKTYERFLRVRNFGPLLICGGGG